MYKHYFYESTYIDFYYSTKIKKKTTNRKVGGVNYNKNNLTILDFSLH